MAGIKRNLQEMYNQNGDSNDSSQQINEAKKTRLDSQQSQSKPADPSCVVHLRNIPQQLTETEIIFLGLTFGPVVNVLFLRSKNQAFLEFQQIQDAQQMITYFSQQPVSFSGKKIFVQYSNHQNLNTDPTNSNNQIAQMALENAIQLFDSGKKGGKNVVLRATITNLLYPVTLDVLHQIFSKFGHVLKVITFNKNDKFQVLIQMKDAICAQQAKLALNNQNIYNGCCTLNIDFSKLTTLEVRFNNEKSRDYTNLLLPSGDSSQMAPTGEQNINLPGVQQMPSTYPQAQQGIIGAVPNMMQASASGNMGGGGGGGGGYVAAFSQPMSNQSVNAGNSGQLPYLSTPVILISNLNEELVTPESLFTLFGVYGDVQRVKILFNKKDSALIQFTNAQQAATALQNLDRCKLWGKQIRCFPSKHINVQMPKDGQPDSGLTKDFTNSALHRFKKPGSKNFNNIFPPSTTLHLSNIPATVQEQDIKEIFSQYGTVRAFRFFQKDRKMALIQMDTVEEAVHALIGTHNYQLAENMHLRCTFSKATI